jgi:hypothetical protein
MLIRSLFYGLVAHLLIGWAFFILIPTPARKASRPPIPVQIHITEKMRDATRKATKAVGPGASGSEAPSSTTKPSSPAGASTTKPSRYSDLLPRAVDGQLPPPAEGPVRDPALIPGHRFKAGSSGVIKQKLVVDASILSGALDVPLHARRISTGSEAFLRIVKVGTDRLKIVDLRGDPMLRAVLFENLHEPRIAALILELMDALQENSLPLALQTLSGAAGRLQDETNFTWIGRKLIIRKAAPPESKAPAGAISLPDEEAKKAILRDRLEFERYQQSRAYRSAIQNYELPTQP